MRIESLQQYQRPRGADRFADLSPDQRAAAEAHYQRLCAKWGDDLPQWRKGILVGRARDLVIRPRDTNWGRALRKCRRQAAPAVSPSTRPQPTPQPVFAIPQRDVGASAPSQVALSADSGHSTSRLDPANVVFSPRVQVASSPPSANMAPSLPAPSPLTPSSPHAVRLDIRGLTARGTDGQDSAQRILRDLELHLGQDLHFSLAVPAKDLPPGWVWRLEVVPVR